MSNSLRRRLIGGRTANDYHMVVAYDGSVTEDGYFRNWANLLGSSKLTLHPLYVKSGGNPLSAVKQAVKYKKKYKYCAEFWCVCDVDGTPDEALVEAKELARQSEIRLALSCRSFEVWLGLHFERSDAEISSEDDAIGLITPYQSTYCARNKSVDFGLFFSKISEALENAIWLENRNLRNPSTSVHKLIKKLHSNLPK